MKRIAAAVVALLALSAPALSHQNESELRLVREIYVYVSDQVTGGCLPTPEVLKTEAELILRRSGILLTDQLEQVSADKYNLSILPVGYAMKAPWDTYCVATLSVRLYRIAEMTEGHYAYVLAYEQAAVMNQSKTDLQSLLREGVSTAVTDLANEILKAQGR